MTYMPQHPPEHGTSLLNSRAVSPHTLLLVVAGTVGSIVVGVVGLIVGIGQGPPPTLGPEPTLISTTVSEGERSLNSLADPAATYRGDVGLDRRTLSASAQG